MANADHPDNEPFSYHDTKRGTVRIARGARTVTTLRGRDAERFLAKLESASAEEAQRAMAKATGHFKHGNERLAKAHPRA